MKETFSTMVLMPIHGVEKKYKGLEGRPVEATCVLVGIVSGDDLHVVCAVRELTPVTAMPP